MRTTVRLDDDAAAAVAHLRRARGLGMSEAINTLARAGIGSEFRTVFRQCTAPMGLVIDVSCVAQALEMYGPASK